jgi:hypothetical protein
MPERLFVWLQSVSWLVDPTGATPLMAFDLGFGAASSILVSPDRRSLLYLAVNGSSYAVAAQFLDVCSEPALWSPWTLGLYTNFGDLSWQPVHR